MLAFLIGVAIGVAAVLWVKRGRAVVPMATDEWAALRGKLARPRVVTRDDN